MKLTGNLILLTVWLAASACGAAPQSTATPGELPVATHQSTGGPVSLRDTLAQASQQPPTPAVETPQAHGLAGAEWDTSPDFLVIRATYCCGFVPQFVADNYIPAASVWGDGRVVWSQPGESGERTVTEGRLSPEQMQGLVQSILDTGFFQWDERYTEPMSPTDMPEKCISIQLKDQAKRVCEYYKGAPEAFHQLYERLAQGAGALNPQPFIPTRGYLTAVPQGSAGQAGVPQDLPVWDAGALGVSLADATSGDWLEGPALKAAWELSNRFSSGALVRQGEELYILSLQIPDVSLMEPPGPTN